MSSLLFFIYLIGVLYLSFILNVDDKSEIAVDFMIRNLMDNESEEKTEQFRKNFKTIMIIMILLWPLFVPLMFRRF